MKVHMKVGDIVLWRGDNERQDHQLWQIEGVYLGCVGQESLIELRNLLYSPGVAGKIGNAVTTFVPEPLVLSCEIYTRVRG